MANLSNYAENALLNKLFRETDFTSPADIYMALHTDVPGDTGANEAAGGSYARQVVVFGAPSDGVIANTGEVTFADMPDTTSAPIVGTSYWDAESGGNCLSWGLNGGTPHVYTGLASSDVLTSYAHGMSDGQRVVLLTVPGGAIPTGLSADTIYFVRDATTDTFKLAATSGGAAINLTGDGGGILQEVIASSTSAGGSFTVGVGDATIQLS